MIQGMSENTCDRALGRNVQASRSTRHPLLSSSSPYYSHYGRLQNNSECLHLSPFLCPFVSRGTALRGTNTAPARTGRAFAGAGRHLHQHRSRSWGGAGKQPAPGHQHRIRFSGGAGKQPAPAKLSLVLAGLHLHQHRIRSWGGAGKQPAPANLSLVLAGKHLHQHRIRFGRCGQAGTCTSIVRSWGGADKQPATAELLALALAGRQHQHS